MKKNILFFAALLMVLVLAGCNSESRSAPTTAASGSIAEENPVEINVVTSYGGDDGNRQNYEKAFRAYEATSGNVVLDASGISNEEWKSRVLASFDENTEPDVLFFFTGADSKRIIEENKVVSVEEIRSVYPEYAANMKDGMLAKSIVDGKSYAIPVNGYWEGMFVNKKVLAACGVDVPDATTTWDEFLADCQKIADNGYIPISVSLREIPHYWFEFCIFNNGNIESHPELPLSSDTPIGQNWAAGLNDIKELYERGFFPENTLTATKTETDVLMIDNKAAFLIEGSWQMGWFAENAADINNFTVTYVPGKGERRPTDIVGGLSMGYFITRKAWDNPTKQAACVEFIQAMTTDEVVATFGATAVTALKNGITPAEDANNLIKDAFEMTKNVTGIVPATADGLLRDSRSDLFDNIGNIVTGQITAEEAIDHCLALNVH